MEDTFCLGLSNSHLLKRKSKDMNVFLPEFLSWMSYAYSLIRIILETCPHFSASELKSCKSTEAHRCTRTLPATFMHQTFDFNETSLWFYSVLHRHVFSLKGCSPTWYEKGLVFPQGSLALSWIIQTTKWEIRLNRIC